MRLIEPLSGIKMLQGHWMTHIMFFIAMWFVAYEADYTAHVEEFPEETEEETIHL